MCGDYKRNRVEKRYKGKNEGEKRETYIGYLGAFGCCENEETVLALRPRGWGIFSRFFAPPWQLGHFFLPGGGEFTHFRTMPGGWARLELTDALNSEQILLVMPHLPWTEFSNQDVILHRSYVVWPILEQGQQNN